MVKCADPEFGRFRLWGFDLMIFFFCMIGDFFSGFFLPFLRVILFSQNLTFGTKFGIIIEILNKMG